MGQLRERNVRIKNEIEEVKQRRKELNQQLLDLEKEILLWERKIQIEVETQEALDPSYGLAELKEMKKEVHRMELRLSQLKRKQEEMIQEMEMAICKREVIHLRSMGMNKKKVTKNATRQEIEQLKIQIKKRGNEATSVERRMELLFDKIKHARNLVESRTECLEYSEQELQNLSNQVGLLNARRAAVSEKIAILSKSSSELERCFQSSTRKKKGLGKRMLVDQKDKKKIFLKTLTDLGNAIPQQTGYFTGLNEVFSEFKDNDH